MPEELFRFMVVRPAEPMTSGKVIRVTLDGAVGVDPEGVELDEKSISLWVEQLAAIALTGRENSGDVERQARVLEFDLEIAQREVHRRLLDSAKSPEHLTLADAARGIAIAQEVHATGRVDGDVAVLKAMSHALLVANPTSLALPPPAPTSVTTPGLATRDSLVFNPPTFIKPGVDLQPRPVGFALLEVVRQQVIRYEAGEVAHIENVLAGESRERVHRTLDRTEDVSVFETETRRDESRNLQSTERFELASEANRQIESRNEHAVGASISASYGPFVQVGLEASAGGSSARSAATKRATTFSREVTDEAASAVSKSVREERKRTVLSEVEETNRHAIENGNSSEHVVGIYQWVEKVMQVQVFSYGERLLYDLVLPEPGAFLSFALSSAENSEADVEPPQAWELKPDELSPSTWLSESAKYRAADVTQPPGPLTKSAEIKIEPGSAQGVTTHTTKIEPPEGYRPVSALIAVEVAKAAPIGPHDLSANLIVSVAGQEQRFDDEDLGTLAITNPVRGEPARLLIKSEDPATRTFSISDAEPGDVPVAIAAAGVTAGAVTVSVILQPTDAQLDQWRHTAYNQIRQSHDAAVATYEAALAGGNIAAGIQIQGRSSSENRRLERDEVKKQMITAFTRQHYERFDGITEDTENDYPQVDLGNYAQQGLFIRFFEQAFEWEQMSWVLYPYYWGRKAAWLDGFATKGADPQLVAFLRAGAARVQLPVRPGFELAVMHFQVHDEKFLPIVQELAEQLDRPSGKEFPVGNPWEVRLPTDLIKLNLNGTLPRWTKDEETGNWFPVKDEEPS